MMRVCFVGVGEAFDEQYPNTSILVSWTDSGQGRDVLLDCGFTAASALYRHAPAASSPDAVWISHFHGDHFLGLPLLLLRFWEENRSKPLIVVGQAGVEEKLWSAFELAYPGLRERINYPVTCITVREEQEIELMGLRWRFARNEHSEHAPSLAVRLDHGPKSVFYSGDGRPTQSTIELANEVNLLIHEAYGLDDHLPGHGSVNQCLAMAKSANCEELALVHVKRTVRANHARAIRQMLACADLQATLPEPGDVIEI